MLIRGVGEGGALTDDGILTFHNGQEDPERDGAGHPAIQRW